MLIVVVMMCLSSGCFLLEQDELMVCDYGGGVSYEVTYLGDSIHTIKIVHDNDLSMFEQATKEQKIDDYRKEVDEHNKVKGLKAELIIDKDLVMLVIDVDIHIYDIDEDEYSIFSIDFEEDDFDTPKRIRDKLDSNNFQCDPIVNE